MYLKLRSVCFFFEKIIEEKKYFLNVIDYQIYSQIEKQELTVDNYFEATDFLLIPQINRNEIAKKYLENKNNKRLLRKSEDKDFFHLFHFYLEDNHLIEDWNHFEQSELVSFAAQWCNDNHIVFSKK